jgi:copper chaperone CopZ
MTRSTYSVSGMSCGHCAAAVTREVERIDGVTGVAVDLDRGTVAVTSEREIDGGDVRAAVERAGYELTGQAG